MFAAMALSLAIGAPVPKAPTLAPPGAPPRVLELKPDSDGKVTVTVLRSTTQKVQVQVVGPNGQVVPETREVPVTRYETVELGDVKDLSITTADGKKLDKDDAMKKLVAGGVVVASSDGKPVSPLYLKVFKDETLVLASPELIAPQTGVVRPNARLNIGGGAAVPLVPVQPLPPGAVLPQAIPAVPPPPPPAVKPADKKEEK
jgi:hypothetical protein